MEHLPEVIDVQAGSVGYRFAVDRHRRLRQVAFGPGATAEPFVAVAPLGAYPAAYPAFDEEPRRAPALRVTHADGTTSTRLAVVEVEVRDDDGGACTRIVLRDEAKPLEVVVALRAWPHDEVVEQWVEVTNLQDGPVALHEVAAASPTLVAGDARLTHFGGDWAAEWTPSEERITLGTKVLESRGGLRPHLQQCPYFLLSPAGPSTEDDGLVLGAALGWGGDLRFAFERTVADQLRVFAGHNTSVGPYVLGPGATFRSPAVSWVWSISGRGPLSRRLHRWVRTNVLRDGHRVRPVVLNNWEATSFDFDERRLLALMDRGAEVGAELFLLDDGWFGVEDPRDDDSTALGDWVADPRKLPGGIETLTRGAAERGLRFGLWVEPEMVNRRSALFRSHPEWIVTQPGRHAREERQQLVLDLLRPEVRRFVADTLDGLLRRHPGISHLKWDANRHITEPGSAALDADRQANLWVDGPLALWEVMAELAAAHPDVELLLCASGGGRIDLGTLRYFHDVWLSDNTDPVARVHMQHAASHFLPAGVVGAHVTAWGRRPLPFACAVALSGRFGFDLDLDALDDEGLAVCRRAVDLHRQVRDLVQLGDLWRLRSPADGVASAVGFTDPAGGDAVVFCYQLGDGPPEALALPLLDPDATYECTSTDLLATTVGTHRGPTMPWPTAGPLTAAVLRFHHP